MELFTEFVEKKERQAKKKLAVIKKIFETSNFKVKDNLKENGFEESQPYVYIYSPDKNLSFEGIRVYSIGGEIAFRAQRTFATHPFGGAHHLNIEEMFDDLMDDGEKMEKVGKEVIKNVVEEIKGFFDQSTKAERGQPFLSNDPFKQIYMRSTGTDYANKVLD